MKSKNFFAKLGFILFQLFLISIIGFLAVFVIVYIFGINRENFFFPDLVIIALICLLAGGPISKVLEMKMKKSN